MITCRSCNKIKTLKHFYIRPDNNKSVTACKICLKNYAKLRRKQFPNYYRSRNLDKYGMTVAKYEAMFQSQKGLCAMCRRKSERTLCVDHDHLTNRVRGLLCTSCNALLGFAQEDQEIIVAAYSYLSKLKYSMAKR